VVVGAVTVLVGVATVLVLVVEELPVVVEEVLEPEPLLIGTSGNGAGGDVEP
jgi:hypothetical protein